MIRDRPPWRFPPGRNDIQALAMRHVRHLYPDLLAQPGPFPIDEYLEIALPRLIDLVVGVLSTQHLPDGVAAVTLPSTDGGPTQVFIAERAYDALGRGDRVARFTAACQAGHVVLHAGHLGGAFVAGGTGGMSPRSGSSSASVLVDGRYVAVHCSQSGHSPCPIASEARAYARAILMNSGAMAMAIDGLGPRPDPAKIADIFQVSFKDAWVRLRELDADDQPAASCVHTRPPSAPARGRPLASVTADIGDTVPGLNV